MSEKASKHKKMPEMISPEQKMENDNNRGREIAALIATFLECGFSINLTKDYIDVRVQVEKDGKEISHSDTEGLRMDEPWIIKNLGTGGLVSSLSKLIEEEIKLGKQE